MHVHQLVLMYIHTDFLPGVFAGGIDDAWLLVVMPDVFCGPCELLSVPHCAQAHGNPGRTPSASPSRLRRCLSAPRCIHSLAASALDIAHLHYES